MNLFMDINIKTRFTRNRLTEIFGGTPGARLALAQGEATLSAQETPHPCPACGRARSSQPPNTPDQGVGAAKECLQTPLCCSSPELKPFKSLHPARQIKCASQKGHICSLTRLVPCLALPSNREPVVCTWREEGQRRGESIWKSLHPGWGGPASIQTLPQGDNQKTGTRSLGPEMVLCEKKVLRSPIFL